jgi:hypothetical protein
VVITVFPTTSPTKDPPAAEFKLKATCTLTGFTAKQFTVSHQQVFIKTLGANLKVDPSAITVVSVVDAGVSPRRHLAVQRRLADVISILYEVKGLSETGIEQAEIRIVELSQVTMKVTLLVAGLKIGFGNEGLSAPATLSAEFSQPSRVSTGVPQPALAGTDVTWYQQQWFKIVAGSVGGVMFLIVVFLWRCNRRSEAPPPPPSRTPDKNQSPHFTNVYALSSLSKKQLPVSPQEIVQDTVVTTGASLPGNHYAKQDREYIKALDQLWGRAQQPQITRQSTPAAKKSELRSVVGMPSQGRHLSSAAARAQQAISSAPIRFAHMEDGVAGAVPAHQYRPPGRASIPPPFRPPGQSPMRQGVVGAPVGRENFGKAVGEQVLRAEKLKWVGVGVSCEL